MVSGPSQTTPDGLWSVALAAPVVLFEIAADGTILASVGAGRGALRHLSTPGESLYDLYTDVPSVLAAFERARGGEAFTTTSRVPGRDDEVVFETTYVPVLGDDGRVASVRGVALDVTARARAQEAEAEASQAAFRLARQLQALTGRLQTEREDERRRVARDVHDELGQALTALRFEADWLRRRLSAPAPLDLDAVRARLDDVDVLLDRAAATVQSVAAGLRPPALDLVGLSGAVQAEAVQFEARTGVRCRVRSAVSSDVEATIPEPVAVSLFRVVQEALTNVARHAGASSVEVRLAVEDGGLVAEVEDDGRGFDPDDMRRGALGLVGARERVAVHRGQLQIRSTPGQGTTVRASVSPNLSAAPDLPAGTLGSATPPNPERARGV